MRTVTWVVIALASACSGGGNTSTIDAAPPVDPRRLVATVSANVNRNVDLLFVIDDSQGMAEKQSAFTASLPAFISGLSSIEGGLPDIHLGVVSTDMGSKSLNGTIGPGVGTVGQGGCANAGDDGKLQTSGAMVTGSFISDIKQTDGSRLKNYTGTLEAVFSQMARLGAAGCGFEQPLHSMQRALQNVQANPGFLRPDANLGVIILADEDDCSISDAGFLGADTTTLGPLASFRCTRFGVRCEVGGKTADEMNTPGEKSNCTSAPSGQLVSSLDFKTFLLGLKNDPKKVFVAGMIGDPTPLRVETRQVSGMNQSALASVCAPAGTSPSDPGLRIKRFLDQFPDRSHFESICAPSLSPALANIAELARNVLADPCIHRPLAMPLDCIVEEQNGAGKRALPQCGSPEVAVCWKIVTDPVKCAADGNQLLAIVRTEAPPPDTVVTARCKI